MREHNGTASPTLVYLPGLHGDWTLIAGFRRALGNRVRFVETTYPRTTTWSLDDYAEGVEQALAQRGISEGWILGESFSSQVVWALVRRSKFGIKGVILSGGFVRHPIGWGVRLAEKVAGDMSLNLLTRLLFGYAKIARYRFRKSPEVVAGIHEFIARRTDQDRLAARHRLHLITQSDFDSTARQANIPVFAITGFFDPIVPWVFVRPWLRRNCPGLAEYKVVFTADHNVLGTAPDTSAEQILRWIRAT